MSKKQFVHIGCGLCAPVSWTNYDISPNLRLQKFPLIGSLFARLTGVRFPKNVRYGDIVEGISDVEMESCRAVYSSHMLEHLSLNDFRIALKNIHYLLATDGIFRLVVPDLEIAARIYIAGLEKQEPQASINFLEETLLGVKKRKKGFMAILRHGFGNSEHLWMWDQYSLMAELREAGFTSVRKCEFNDSSELLFRDVEQEGRFRNAVAIEAIK